MKRLFTLLFLVSFMIPVSSQKTTTSVIKSPRMEKTINSDWTFNYFPEEKVDEGYEAPGYDDSKWPVISIPHTWMTYETTGDNHPFIMNTSEDENPYWWTGWGWYRKHFVINKGLNGRKVFIEFEGVQKYCKIWINGKYLGDHKGGYGSFDFDLTGFVNEGKENVIVVAVSNRQKDPFRIPPMTAGSFNVYGGIYRSVTIVLKDKLYIPMQGSAAHEGGTFITTPQVSEKEGIVRIQTWVKNDYLQPKICVLNTYIFDATNRVVQVITSTSTINPGQLFMFDQTSKPVRNPRLWSFENPYLYRVQSEVADGKTIADTYSSPLGFRWFRWDCNENCLYLNDKKAMIQSGTYFQEYPWLGAVVPPWIVQMDFKSLKESLEFNFIRTGYFPCQRLVYDLADKYGIVVVEETPGINNKEFSPEVQDQLLKEMIRRDRNHPSVLFWSFGNESSFVPDSKLARIEDPSRILVSRRVPDYSATDYVTFTEDSKSCDIVFNETTADQMPLPGFAGSDGKSPAVPAVKTGEPARIIITG